MRDAPPSGGKGLRCLPLPAGALASLVAACAGGGPAPGPEAFPPHPAKAAFLRACGACHTPKFVLGPRRSPEQWSQLIDRMVERGAKVSRHDRDPIAAYLMLLQDRKR